MKWQLQWFQCRILRKYGSYVKVSRPDGNYKVVKKPNNDLLSFSKALHLKITANGPITVADYMRQCLANPSLGYYMQKDMIGEKGDFITSPEISQMFGEIIGTWIFHEFRKIGSPKPWQIIELGPGKGTLMKDVLKTLNTFKATDDLSVHLVEISPGLASLQATTLSSDVINIGVVSFEDKSNSHYKTCSSLYKVPIYWYDKLEKVPKGFSVILAHEFFDALPIHKFQKTSSGWREVLIDSTMNENGTNKFNYVISPKETVMSKLLIAKDEKRDHVEISHEAGLVAQEIAQRLEEFGGFSLFIDYGHFGEKQDTFRAFKNHQLVDPLTNPGLSDLTADVNFNYLTEIMKDKMFISGPIEQGKFLNNMGMNLRLKMLLKSCKNEQDEKILVSAYNMLTDDDKMGSRYKCLAAFPLVLKEHLTKYPVAGFH
ncbi:conserved hypothetical protein [Pediculus humanus corporis]|uniref:Protein arginine methyltransferase NDUFAF7 n=1 Tax=Pediculus humanus subsp. corporis TaxID=121224 RepID=E0VC44_PEDHC|nr:uncharacterized protein Phum_PHUM079850 [Pediculus humanus corporis]EEB10950.1 conserved hypothetical protein [Pediculus humanus corporis]